MIYTKEMINKINMKKEKRKKIWKIFSLPFFIIIVLFVASILFQKFVIQSNNIDFFGYKPLFVMTGSMEPEINIGDIIIIKSVPQNEIKVDDVITFSFDKGKNTTTHRVIDIKEEDGKKLYQTKGDNNNAPDPDLVSYDEIVGKLNYNIVGIGKMITYMFTGTGLCIIIFIVSIHYLYTNKKRVRIIAREEARRIYNIPKYKGKKNQYDN